MKALSTWTPKAIYLGVVLFCAYKIVTVYMGHIMDVNQAINGF